MNRLLYHKLLFISEMMDRRSKRKEEGLSNISRGQGRILAVLKKKDGISTKDLAYILDITVSSLNEVLKKLEQNGYIKKEPSPKDKRILLVKLTPKGKEFKFHKPGDSDIFNCLEYEEKVKLVEYLDKIILEFHEEFKREDLEKFKKMQEERKKIFKKYFHCDEKKEWYKIIDE